MAARVQEISGWIDLDGAPRAADLTLPSSAPERAILWILPLCEERKATHRALRETTRALAAENAAILRFDVSGCGDSPGEFSRAVPDDWIREIAAADTRLRRAFPGLPVVWIGVRLGALLAARLLRQVSWPPDGFIAWAPPASGHAWMESLLQRYRVNRMMAFGHAAESVGALRARLSGGRMLDLDGFLFSPETYRQVTALQWPELPVETAPSFLALLTRRSEATIAALRNVSRKARIHEVRFPPFWNTVGYVDPAPLIEPTREWLAALRPRTLPPPGARTQTPEPASRAGNLFRESRSVFPDEGEETFVEIPTGGSEPLRGLLHIPHRPFRGTLLFLHGWSGLRLGPHRMFVTAAREFARAGFAGLRFDFQGRGDSPGSPSEATIASMLRDTLAALDWIKRSRLGLPDPVLLLGICSGCKVALHAAAARPGEIDRLLLWSPEPMGRLRPATQRRDQRLRALKTYLLKLARPASWKKIFTGNLAGGMVVKALMQTETRTEDEAIAEDRALDRLRAWHGEVGCVFGGSDPRTPNALRAYREFFRKHRNPARFQVIDHAGHSFYAAEWEKQVVAFSLDFLERPWEEASRAQAVRKGDPPLDHGV